MPGIARIERLAIVQDRVRQALGALVGGYPSIHLANAIGAQHGVIAAIGNLDVIVTEINVVEIDGDLEVALTAITHRNAV